MKNLFTTLISCIAIMFLAVLPAAAQTPDGQTPAEETVCDPLKSDGISKGLYGLCVAFCEAQDHAELATPITGAELATLESNAPSGRILANYNKKRQATDPAMPCILVEESCPCWSSAELNEINGLAPSGAAAATSCGQLNDPVSGLIDVRLVAENAAESFIQAIAWDQHRATFPGTVEQCQFLNRQVSPPIFRRLNVSSGTLTHAQAVNCLAQVNAQCAALGH